MKKESRVAILGFGLGFGLFWLLNHFVLSKEGGKVNAPTKKKVTDQEIEMAVTAYEEALQNGEDPATLMQLNDTFASDFNIQVTTRTGDGVLMVTDMAGNQIATYDPSASAATPGV